MTALQTGAVLACVKIICGGVASLPLHVFEQQIRDNRVAKRRATDHPLYPLLYGAPNEEMTSHTFRSVMQVHMLLWGNGYAEIERNGAAQPVALWPRNPARTRPVRLTREAKIEGTIYPPGTLIYHTSETMGDEIAKEDDSANRMAPERIILAEDMIHIPGLSLDGRLGQSTVYLARQIIGLSLATEKFGAKFFGNGAVPRGVLEIPNALEQKALENLRRSWAEAHGGENAHKTAVLEQGIKYTPIGIDPEKSQFLESRHYQRGEVAAIFQVPLHMIGEKEAAKSSVEQTSIEFLNYCLNPWLDAWEQELKRKLSPNDKPAAKPFFMKFDVRKLLYPDAASRAAFYTSGKNTGWMNSNDIREFEDMNPIEDGSGDIYWMPVNMQDAAHPATAPHMSGGAFPGLEAPPKPEAPLGGAPKNKVARSILVRYERSFYGLFKDGFGRLWTRFDENGGVGMPAIERCFNPALHAILNQLGEELKPADVETPLMSGDLVADLRIEAQLILSELGKAGKTPEARATHTVNTLRRTVERLAAIVAWRYNPEHDQQPRHPDGTFHDGKKDFFIGRHGTTDDDVKGVWSGHRDVQINAEGKAEIAKTIEKMKGLGIRRIVASPLLRTKTTAQMYADALGVPVTMDARLAALKLGVLEGLSEDENANRLEPYLKNPDAVIPGGEAVGAYRKRGREVMEELKAENDSSGPILAISHSSLIANYLEDVRGEKLPHEDLTHSPELLSPAGVLKLNGKKIQVIAGTLETGDAA